MSYDDATSKPSNSSVILLPPPVNCLPEILTLGKTGILKTLDFSVDIVDFLVFLIDAAGVV